MAPFHPNPAGGKYRKHQRGGKPIAKTGQRSSNFATSRLQEDLEDLEKAIEHGDNRQMPSDEDEEQVEASSSEDEGNTGIDSYNALLQVLDPLDERRPPKKKRRKTGNESAVLAINVPTSEVEEVGLDDVDQAEESEGSQGGENTSIDGDEGLDRVDDDKNGSDPFDTHFAHPEGSILTSKIDTASQRKWRQQTETKNYRLKIFTPDTKPGVITTRMPGIISLEQLRLKPKINEAAKEILSDFTEAQKAIVPHIFDYKDILFCQRTPTNGQSLRQLASLHALNHIFKTRDRVVKNNARATKEDNEADADLRDQGFTRPKVLVLLPTRQSCAKFVEWIISFSQVEQQENRKRFEDSYVGLDEKFSDDKPEDFRDLFGGNDDDMFRVGIKFTRKTVRFFSQFYNSDIILASPLGLRMAMGSEDSKKEDYDFLSSIEICIMDQTDALLMQNWDHVEHIFEHLNLQPKEAHGCDFGRVRNWYLDNHAKYLRQTIVLSAFNTPELNNLFLTHMNNVAGKAKIDQKYDGAIVDLGFSVKQTFSRLDSLSPANDPDDRFKYFTTTVIPFLDRSSRTAAESAGVLLFIPSYLDFVRIRNYLSTSSEAQNISFGAISEYTSVRNVARARSHFHSGRHSVLLYTERAHHFRRYTLKGVKKVLMYGLPNNPTFYSEIVGYLGLSINFGKLDLAEASAQALFSKWDWMKLERIVGTKRVVSMVKEKGGDTFDFV
ncbi:MAG: rRNA-binding ribosome biosynthesis protein utp25 [Cirrosporium novae-zelandiae]|nr:MAG: rRNA-binding ribosome biosynthesis protein utp25 [Cirrosporium novae-zelandiae]